MARSCPSCSTQNIDGARFCRTCGTILQPSAPPPPSVVDQTPYQPNYPPQYQPQNPTQYQPQNPYNNPTSIISPGVSTAPNYGMPVQQPYNALFGNAIAAPYAGFWVRWLAYTIDRIVPAILLVPSYIYMASELDNRNGPEPLAVIIFMICLFVTFVYFMINIYLLGKNGATIGKSLMGLKCLGPDGLPLGFGKAFLRELAREGIGILCGIAGLIDHLTMLSDIEKQTWHDKIIGSHVFKL